MSNALPSSVPPVELELARVAGRVSSRYAIYPPLSALRADYDARLPAAIIAHGGHAETARALSVYVHTPFCYAACAYCSCTKIVTRDGGKAVRYLDYLERDIAAQAAAHGGERRVVRGYWGGGTPTYYTMGQLRRVWDALRRHFSFADDGEFTVEIDPRTVSEASLQALRAIGYTIASLGIPDLDADVLRAVGREQPAELSLQTIAAARRAGFPVVAVDVMYGLPRQTAATFVETVTALAAAAPDRLHLHDYVHAPRRHKGQRQLRFAELPRASERLDMLGFATRCLTAKGYVHVGADCYVRPGDALHAARAAGRLHYDMLGYSAAGETDVVPVGMSAVGMTDISYTQNESELGAYYDRVGSGLSPIARGLALTPDDAVRRLVIRLLLCQGRVPYAAVEALHSIAFERYFAPELQALERYAAAGLVQCDARALVVEGRGRLWVRNLCAVFDRHHEPRRETRARPGSSL